MYSAIHVCSMIDVKVLNSALYLICVLYTIKLCPILIQIYIYNERKYKNMIDSLFL
jgi:hypothetical protein